MRHKQEPQEPDKTDFEDKDAQFDVQMQPQGCASRDSRDQSSDFSGSVVRNGFECGLLGLDSSSKGICAYRPLAWVPCESM